MLTGEQYSISLTLMPRLQESFFFFEKLKVCSVDQSIDYKKMESAFTEKFW